MKRSILITLFFLIYKLAIAQNSAGISSSAISEIKPVASKGNNKISGVVIDSASNQPVPFATIALNDPNTSKPVNGTICKEDGKFELEKIADGKYQIAVSFIGYKTKIVNNVNVDGNDINLGKLILSAAVTQLKEVTVEGQKAIFEEKVDRTVYNAEHDQTNKGGDATDVLRKVPMLSVDLDGNPSLRGSTSVKVLINNRPSTIAASSIADALKQIPAEMIKSVEVITSPSARYDAEGSAGIINIITKKNTMNGFSLGFDSSVGLRGSNLGLNGSYRKGKMGFSLSGFGRAGYNVNGSFNNSQSTFSNDTTFLSLQNADTRNNFAFGRYQFGWDYDINERNYITSSVQFGLRNNKSFQDNLLTQSFENGVFTRNELYDVNTKDLSNNWDVNLNYTHTTKKPQEEFSILTQYSRNDRNNDFIRDFIENSDGRTAFDIKNLNKSYNEEITLQADYQNPITKTQMVELGAKQILRNVTSDYSTFNKDDNGNYVLINNSSSNNIFNYNQNVSAGYLSYTLGFLKNYTAKAGLRYEYTDITAHLQNENDRQIPSYGTLVPSVNISKKLKNGNTLKAAYNRRIQRPSIQFLNPNIQAGNRNQQTIGNPDLRPEFTNNFELSYNTRYKIASFSITGFLRNTNNSIESIREAHGDTIVTRYGNIGLQNSYGSSLFININASNKLSFNGGGDVYYSELKNNVSDARYNASNSGVTANFRFFGNYTVAKGWGVQLFTFYRLRQIQLQGTQGGFGIYSLSVKKDFNNKRGSVGFGAENFFTSSFKVKNELNSPVIAQNSTTVLHNMNFKINFSYRIGKLNNNADQSKRRKKSVSNDDLKEGGGDNSGAGANIQGAGPSTGGATPAVGGAPGGAPAGGQYQRPSQPGQAVPGHGQPAQGQWNGQKREEKKVDGSTKTQPADTTVKEGQNEKETEKKDDTIANPESQKQDSTQSK
jgi:ferric enterobactin receptor